MVEQGSGLVVEVTDGDQHGWRYNLFYDMAKMGAIRMAYSMGAELAGKGVTVVAVTPGFLRSEAMLDKFGVTEDNWRDQVKTDPHFAESETPWFVGRAVAALAADPKVASKSGKVYASWTLAKEYLFSDQDGTRPDWGRYFDQETRRILDAGGAKTPDEEFWLRVSYFQLHRQPERHDDARRIAGLIGMDFLVP